MSLQVETAEALCSALYKMPFVEFLGEQDRPVTVPGVMGGEQSARHAYFHVGEHPKDMRVTVIRPEKAEQVIVLIEWRNYFSDGRSPLKGEQVIYISTYAASQAELGIPTQDAILRVLELYKQVLSEEGVAGKIADLVESDEPE